VVTFHFKVQDMYSYSSNQSILATYLGEFLVLMICGYTFINLKRLKTSSEKTLEETETMERLWGRGSTLRVSKFEINMDEFRHGKKEETETGHATETEKRLSDEEKVSRSLIFIVWYFVAQIIVSVVICRSLSPQPNYMKTVVLTVQLLYMILLFRSLCRELRDLRLFTFLEQSRPG
jgi:hypothetical protein